MPVLKREPDLSPSTLFELDRPWWVAHVRSRQEKSFARYLGEHGIAFYLPQIEKTIRRGARKVTSYLPLFAGYVFFRGYDSETSRALRSHLVVNLLAPPDQASFDTELRQLRALQQDIGRLNPYPFLVAGNPVVITEGIFEGYRGVVVRDRGEERLVVSISFIRKSVSVDVDRDFVRPDRGVAIARPDAW